MGGTSWPSVDSIAVFDDGFGPALCAGGGFTIAGGMLSTNIVAWRCPASAVFADDFEDATTGAWTFTVP